MKNVYLLWHTHIDEDLQGGEDTKLIGVYSSEEKATGVVEYYKTKPGFNGQPENFEIVRYDLDKDEWTEGFFTSVIGE